MVAMVHRISTDCGGVINADGDISAVLTIINETNRYDCNEDSDKRFLFRSSFYSNDVQN